jgi:hypothetical protein
MLGSTRNLAAGLAVALAITTVSAAPHRTELHDKGAPTHSVARLWNDQVLEAIRIDIPKPTVHARNLFHVSVAMWDAWAAYDPLAVGYLVRETRESKNVAAARAEAISYAAYRVLKHRYRFGPGEETSQAAFDNLMQTLGYDRAFTSTLGDTPAALGNRIGQAIVEHGFSDGANEGPELDYADDTGYAPVNPELVFKLPGTEMLDPNRWQPLAFDFRVLQNGIVIGESIQEFINPNWGKVEAFGLTDEDLAFPWVYHDPGLPPQLGGAGDAQFKANAVEVIGFNSRLDPTFPETIDISPGSYGNNPLGGNDGTGHPVNPYTGEPYASNVVKVGDFGRVMAEFWADGPASETPPGHWNTLANYVADHPLFEHRFSGQGEVLDALEWDVKVYLALNGALHDAAIFAWGCKGYYDYSRPISHIRYMSGLGQSSDPSGPSYHPDGIPLEPGLIEVITAATTQPGGGHAGGSRDTGRRCGLDPRNQVDALPAGNLRHACFRRLRFGPQHVQPRGRGGTGRGDGNTVLPRRDGDVRGPWWRVPRVRGRPQRDPGAAVRHLLRRGGHGRDLSPVGRDPSPGRRPARADRRLENWHRRVGTCAGLLRHPLGDDLPHSRRQPGPRERSTRRAGRSRRSPGGRRPPGGVQAGDGPDREAIVRRPVSTSRSITLGV